MTSTTDAYTHLIRFQEEIEMEIEDAGDRVLEELNRLEDYAKKAKTNLAAGGRLPSGYDPTRIVRDLEVADAQRNAAAKLHSKVTWMIRTSAEAAR